MNSKVRLVVVLVVITWEVGGLSLVLAQPGPVVTPTIRGAQPVLQAFLGGDRISPGTWVEIYGENFAAQAKDWSGLIQGNQAPTSIDGVRVNFGNRPAYMYFVSPTQINAQVPDGVGPGSVSVEVVTAGGRASTTVQVSAVSPALLTTPAFQVGGRQYVAALFSTELNQGRQVFVGRPNLIPGAVFRPAKPGDVLTIFAVGCGPTNPPSAAGQVVQGLRQLVNSPQVLFGQTTAQAAGFLSAGVIGLCQLNITVPNVAGDSSGDIPINVTIGGVRNAQNLFTAVQPAQAATRLYEAEVLLLKSAPAALAVADMNADGVSDIVAADGSGPGVSVFLGVGNGLFRQERYTSLQVPTMALAIADFNRDGFADVVLVPSYGFGRELILLRGRGDGTFDTQAAIPLGGQPEPFGVFAADMNGDGMPDIVTASSSLINEAEVLLGNGDGTFRPGSLVPVRSAFIHVADVNGDRTPDLLTLNLPTTSGLADISIFLGAGGGSFKGEQRFNLPAGTSPGMLRVADFNHDGAADILAVTSGDPDGLLGFVLLADGRGAFQAPQRMTLAVGALAGGSVEAADLNGDGVIDLVVQSGTVAVLLGRGDGTFRPGPRYPILAGRLALGDMTGDGLPDLIVAVSDAVSTRRNNGDGTFQTEPGYGLGDSSQAGVVVDVNGDGNPDVVSTSARNVSVMLGAGDGTFKPPRRSTGGTLARALAVADLTGDAALDIVLAEEGSSSVLILAGNRDGTFRTPQRVSAAGEPFGLAVGDLNGDGVLDVVTANARTQDVSVLLGNGNASFGAARTFGAASSPFSVALADLNGDRNLDIVTSNNAAGVSVLLGSGNGTFRSPQRFAVAGVVHAVAFGDLNGDGTVDIVARGGEGGRTVSILLGVGDGTFRPGGSFEVGSGAGAPVVTDVNIDGILDIIVPATSGVTVLMGAGRGEMQSPRRFGVTGSPLWTAVADVNGDGLPDLVTITSALDVRVLLHQ